MTRDNDTSAENEKSELGEYKKTILPVNKGRLKLERDLYFKGTTQRGYDIEYDVNYEMGCTPTETLLMSMVGCLSIDVVHMLRKMRCTITSYEAEFDGERMPDPPQYYKSMDITIHVGGEGITPKKIERAISLSQEKYCSVYHSLRKDLKLSVTYKIED